MNSFNVNCDRFPRGTSLDREDSIPSDQHVLFLATVVYLSLSEAFVWVRWDGRVFSNLLLLFNVANCTDGNPRFLLKQTPLDMVSALFCLTQYDTVFFFKDLISVLGICG